MKVMISQPMNGKAEEVIREEREELIKALESKLNENTFIKEFNSYFKESKHIYETNTNELLKTKKITFESEEEVSWTLDGEFGGNHTLVEIENRHEALNLYLKSTKEE